MFSACAASFLAAYTRIPLRGQKYITFAELSPALVAAENNTPVLQKR
jgi:hypothetical protein